MADCFLFSASFYFLFHYFLQLLSGEVSEPVSSLPTYRFVVGEKPSFAQNYFARWWKFGWASQKWELSVLRGRGGSISAESWPHILGGTPFSPAFGTAGDAATPRGIPAENWLRKKISQFWLLELSMRWLGLETSLNGSKPDQASGNSFPLLCLGWFCAKAADFLTPKCLVNPCWCPRVSHFKIFQSISEFSVLRALLLPLSFQKLLHISLICHQKMRKQNKTSHFQIPTNHIKFGILSAPCVVQKKKKKTWMKLFLDSASDFPEVMEHPPSPKQNLFSPRSSHGNGQGELDLGCSL